MNMQPVNSKMIRSIGYDATSRKLAVEFHTNEVYHYENVPPETYQMLMTARSIGGYFSKHIRNSFEHQRQL